MKRILSILGGIAMAMALSANVSAQGGYEVKGSIADQLGPVVGATVIETGTTNGTVTDYDGNFSLTVASPDAMVTVSCIGYSSVSY